MKRTRGEATPVCRCRKSKKAAQIDALPRRRMREPRHRAGTEQQAHSGRNGPREWAIPGSAQTGTGTGLEQPRDDQQPILTTSPRRAVHWGRVAVGPSRGTLHLEQTRSLEEAMDSTEVAEIKRHFERRSTRGLLIRRHDPFLLRRARCESSPTGPASALTAVSPTPTRSPIR